MTVRHMKIFIQVYQTQSITRAAELLHMTQPAVTRAIQEIEHYYGVHLFERLNRRLYRTESGRMLYEHAIHIVDSFDRMEKGLRDWDEFGVLRVGGSITLGNVLLPGVTAAFRTRHPDLRVKVTVSNGEYLQECLLDNRLDLALIEGGMFQEPLHVEPLLQDRLVLIFPLHHELGRKEKIYLRDLAGYDLLLREPGSAGRSFVDQVFAARNIQVEPVWESASTQAIVKAVAAGLGISLLPRQLVLGDIRAGTVATRPVEDESLQRENFMVWHRNKFLTPSALDFLEECRRWAKYGG